MLKNHAFPIDPSVSITPKSKTYRDTTYLKISILYPRYLSLTHFVLTLLRLKHKFQKNGKIKDKE